jgi:hypothetical protein
MGALFHNTLAATKLAKDLRQELITKAQTTSTTLALVLDPFILTHFFGGKAYGLRANLCSLSAGVKQLQGMQIGMKIGALSYPDCLFVGRPTWLCRQVKRRDDGVVAPPCIRSMFMSAVIALACRRICCYTSKIKDTPCKSHPDFSNIFLARLSVH